MTTATSMNPSLFRVICILHSVIALTSGTLMMFYTEKASIFGPGSEIASKLKDREFHSFFAGGIEDLAYEWPKQALGDIALGISWVFFLVYSWREKYD
ncbi:BnaA05g14730D [Brassica napus]|uniref:BnaA05g14730D protein n=1 Tax=Brassica napus TaxID=3708 RepID=A0A078GL51_BRANA|nr:BnaA05g14730D [Brassica napus]